MLIGFSIAHLFYAFQTLINRKYFYYPVLLFLAGLCAIIPDIDSFFGNYASRDVYTGHRGITHSILFVCTVSLTITLAMRTLPQRPCNKSNILEGNKKFIMIFFLLFLCGLSHLLADLPQPPGVWGGIPLFFPYKTDGSFLRIGGWSKVGWYDYKILWSYIFCGVTSAILTALLSISEKVKFEVITKTTAVLLMIINLSINIWLIHYISNSRYVSAADWEKIQNEFLKKSPPMINTATRQGRVYFIRLFRSIK